MSRVALLGTEAMCLLAPLRCTPTCTRASGNQSDCLHPTLSAGCHALEYCPHPSADLHVRFKLLLGGISPSTPSMT